MGNLRVLLWVAFGLMLYLNYEAWNHDYAPAPVAASAPSPSGRTGPSLEERVPERAASAPASEAPGAPAAAPVASVPPPSRTVPGAAEVHVKTDVLDLAINLEGGTIDEAALRQYPLHKDTPNVPVVLENRNPATLYLLESGLIGMGDEAAPTHRALFTAVETNYALPANEVELKVPLSWSDGHGLTVTKTFVFHRGSYAIGVDYTVRNDGAAARRLASYAEILRHWEHPSRSYFDVETYSFKGPEVYDGHKARNLNVENEADSRFSQPITGGWLAALQHHFVSAIVPPPAESSDYQLTVQDHEFLFAATGPFKDIPAGGSGSFHETLFVGPKLQSQLAAAGPKLDLTVDYGHLTFIAQPLFAVLSWVEHISGNWGLSIILVTALIKLAFYPLSQASGRSMAKMRAVAPRMKQIQETYKDDREKLGRAMMELYKREKINPLTGCLPMIVQIPFFFSFYWVLLESVEMRQAPFMLWINDLSSRDPYFILPALMGIAMFGQFKLNPPPPDPMQAKIMQFMPLVMTATMMWFPAGLVLYWLTNTVLSILQQWRINQVVQAETAKHRS